MPNDPVHSVTYRRARTAVIVCILLAVALWTAWPWLPWGKEKHPRTIVLYGFSILEPVITRGIFPAFQKKWMDKTGQHVELISSFGGSGTVTAQLIMGVPAEIAILSTELDALRLKDAGTVRTETWKDLPHKGIVNRTPFIILVRLGNPKKIRDFPDLTRKGVHITHTDPLTSGAANWAIVAEYGAAARQPGAGPDAGRSMLLGIWRNVTVQAGSDRAAKTQFDNGFGDALITYEQTGLSSRSQGSSRFEIIYPRSTILSEHTVVVMDHRLSGRQAELVRAFVDFLWSEEAQRIFVESGFRSVDERLNSLNPHLGSIRDPFLIDDLGGWKKAKHAIVDEIWKNGVLKELKP